MSLPLYLLWRLYFSLAAFLRDWYLDSFKWTAHRALSILEELDKTLALKISLRHLFQPLYGDRTIIGYVMGFFWRLWRIVVASLIYLVIIALVSVIYFLWLSLPIYLLFKTIEPWLPTKIL